MTFTLHSHTSTEALASALASSIAASLRSSIAARGHAALAVSGGRTPIAMFEALSAQVLPWQAVEVLQVDERVVEIEHADSNAHLITTHLLQQQAAAAHFHPLMNSYNKKGVVSVCKDFAAIKSELDVVHLGMGEDGHFASLFPHTAAADAALQHDYVAPYCMGAPSPLPQNAPYQRISMSLPTVLRAQRIVLQTTGAARLALLHAAANGEQPQLPIAKLIAAASGRLEVWWAA